MNQDFFQAPDGRLFSRSLVEVAIPLADGRWQVHLRGGRLPIEVANVEFLRTTFIRARKGETIFSGADGLRHELLGYRVPADGSQATPVLGCLIKEPPPINFSSTTNPKGTP